MSSKKFAVVGDPISHSLSPVIHGAAYKHLGLDWSYEAKQVSSDGLAEFLKSHLGVFSGLSVTMPLKFEAAKLGGTVDDYVSHTGVANTLLLGSEISAFNTDVFGIERSLEAVWHSQPEAVAVLGSGATARSTLMAVSNTIPKARVIVYARSADKCHELVELFPALNLSSASLDSFRAVEDLVVNTLPSDVSLPGFTEASNAWLLNVGYANKKSAFAQLFSREKIVGGEEMLIWQAIQQIRIFVSGDKQVSLGNESILYKVMKDSIQDDLTGVGE